MERLPPEAACFLPENGKWTAMMAFDSRDLSQMRAPIDPLFDGRIPEPMLTPVMNADDLGAGLEAFARLRG